MSGKTSEVIAPFKSLGYERIQHLGTSVNTNQLLDETWAESVDIELALGKHYSGDPMAQQCPEKRRRCGRSRLQG